MISKRAYSLSQLIVVVAIMAFIALAAVPLLGRFYQMLKLRTTMDQLVNDVRAARQAAITLNVPVKITPIVLSQYTGMTKDVTSGYAIYQLTGRTAITGAGDTYAGTYTNWKEIVTSNITPSSCGSLAFKARFIPYPITLTTPTATSKLKPGLFDLDNDGNWDLVFLPTGAIYWGPYPCSTTGMADWLNFNESMSDLKSATPQLVLRTTKSTAYDTYCISFTFAGKVTVFGYHS